MQFTPGTLIKTAQPKLTLPNRRESIALYMDRGWIAQPKIDGWNVQLQIDEGGKVVAITRNGNRLTHSLPVPLKEMIQTQIKPQVGYNVVNGEWVASQRCYFLFDFVVCEGVPLDKDSYEARYARLPPCMDSASPLRTVTTTSDIDKALEWLSADDDLIEGVVLKNPRGIGFIEADLARARKDGHRHSSRL